jgi:hypothetical protein
MWSEEELKDGLHTYILKNFKTNIPRTKVCPNHDAPFDFVYDAFVAKHKMILAMANRSGGKTWDMSILQTLNSIGNDNCESANLGAIQAQALRCASYIKGFIRENADFQRRLAQDPTATKILWSNGSLNEILVATTSGVNSPHPSRLIMDEVELIPWPILNEAFSMVQSKNGVDSCTVLGSTRKFAAGPMQRLVEDASKRGLKVYTWCMMETVEPLPEDPKERQRIFDVFGDDLPEGVENCSGYYKWSDLIDKYRSLDRYVWDTQWLCKRPDTQGLVYSRFDDVLNFERDFKIDREKLNNGWGQVYLFEDFGTSANHPGVILFAYYDKLKQEIILFDELYSVGKPSDVIIEEMLAKLSTHGLTRADIAGWICDPHNNAEQMHRANKGYPMMGNYFVTDPSMKLPGDLYIVKNGISHMRKFIDDRRLKITENMIEFRREMMSYAYKKNMRGEYTEEAEKDNDHGPDACRYGLIWLFPLQAAGSFGADDYKSSKDEEFVYDTFTGGLWDKKL